MIEEDSQSFDDSDSVESSQDALANQAIAEYLRALDAGKPLDAKAWLARHRQVRNELLNFLDDQRETGNEIEGGKFQELIDEVRPTDLEATTDFGSLAASGKSDTPSIRGGRLVGSAQTKPPIVADIRLGRLLGAGGMGHVYEGVDSSGQSVAVKLLSPNWSRSQESIDRFRQEGAIASAINHPRCVFVRAADTDNGCPYIVMELMSGETLKDLVLKRGPIRYQEALRLLLDLAEGLEEAHSHDLIHRDVKPANCYLEGNSGRVKVGDFGLARSIVSPSDLTASGGFLGTPLYASPEQIRGELLDGRTDIYSLCATLYYLLTGQAPFAADSPTKTIARIVSEDPKSVREFSNDIPIAVERLVAKGLSRDRETRYQSMSELIAAIRPLIHTQMLAVTYGKRIAAAAIDLGIYSTFTSVIAFAFAPEMILTGDRSAVMVYGLLPFIFCYFFLFEKFKGATPGKQLLRMKVVDGNNLELPNWYSALIRTTLFLFLFGYGCDALMRVTGFTEPSVGTFVFLFLGYVVGYGLMFTTIGKSPDRPLLQDWLSGTRVIEQINVTQDRFSSAVSPPQRQAIAAEPNIPQCFGRFKTIGKLGKDAFLAEDLSLGRKVWVILHRDRSGSVRPSTTRQLDRTTRVRHVQSGNCSEGNWDAFLAIDGAPLSQWVDEHRPLDWRDARSIMQQFCDEIIQSRQDGSMPRFVSMNQIWVDSRGRLVVLDDYFRSIYGRDDESAEFDPAAMESLQIVNRIAMLALSGKESSSLSSDGKEKVIIERPLPLHARKLLDSLNGSRLPQYESIDQLRGDLAASERLATKLETKHRVAQVFLTLLIVSGLFGATISLIRLGNQVGARLAFDALAGGEVLRRISSDDEAFRRFTAAWANDSGDMPARQDLPKIADLIDQQCAKILRTRLEGAGTVQRFMFTNNGIGERIIEHPGDYDFEVLEEDDVTEFQLSIASAMSKPFRMNANDLSTLIVDANIGNAAEIKKVGIVFGLGLLSLVASLVWDVLFLGGWSAWIVGVRYVDKRGKRAGFTRHFARSFLLHLPLLAIAVAIITVDLWVPSYLWMSNVLFGIGLLVVFMLAVLTILKPTGNWADRIAGTFPVPR